MSETFDAAPSSAVYWRPENPADLVKLGDRMVPRVLLAEVGFPLHGVPDGEPMATFRLEVIGDRPQLREVCFRAAIGGRELRQADIESFRVGDWVERVFVAASALDFASLDAWREAAPDVRRAVSSARRGYGPRKVDREFLAEVAGVYRRNVDERPTRTVAEAFGIAHSTAAEYVRRARAAGLLPPTTSGKRKA